MSLLFQIGKIGNLVLKNRVIMSPMNVGGNNESDGCLSQRGIDYFVERAKGGVGMIVTGAVRVSREFERDKETIPLWMLFADHMIHTKWISELSERCHDYGAKVCIQLTAGGGRLAGAYAQQHGLAIAPSEVPCFYPPYLNARELTKEEIHRLVVSFENAARIVKNAGADAIQLHGHQGYLLDQFSTSLWNHRKDEYGGSLENRLLFARQIVEAIKRGAGQNFPVIYRFGLTHFLEGGRTIEEGLEMARMLERFGIDALDIDSGCYENNYYPHPPETIECGSFACLAEKVKGVVSIPVISSTRIGYPEVAESILTKKQADFVSLGRPLIADPNWCQKTKEEREDEIRPCLACHEGCLRRLHVYKSLSCAVNPAAGNENYLKIERSEKSKSIIVVGGGITGIVASLICEIRGHSVTLYEKDSELGGNFKSRYLPSFKSDYKKYIAYLKKQLEMSRVKVVLNNPINMNNIHELSADIIIIAIGASFKTFEIDGISLSDLTNPFELYKDKTFSGKRVAIIGGGMVGVEAALNVSIHGGEPFIVEKSSQVASTAYIVNKQHVEFLLKERDIPIYLNTSVNKVENGEIICSNSSGTFSRKFDIIAECVGMESNKLGIEASEKVIVLGDADHPTNVMNAVWSAYRQCRLL